VIGSIRCSLEELLQGEEATGLVVLLLAMDLLEAQDVGGEPCQLWTHEGYALLQRGLFVRLVVEVLQVERSDAQPLRRGARASLASRDTVEGRWYSMAMNWG
jgi:hypothetical protein